MGFPLEAESHILGFLAKTKVRGNPKNQNMTLFSCRTKGVTYFDFPGVPESLRNPEYGFPTRSGIAYFEFRCSGKLKNQNTTPFRFRAKGVTYFDFLLHRKRTQDLTMARN